MAIIDALNVMKSEIKESTGETVYINELGSIGQDGSNEGIYLSLVNIMKDNNLGKVPPFTVNGGASVEIKEPPVYVNLMVMVTSVYREYDTALTHLNSALEYFQSNPYLDEYSVLQDTQWPDGLEKLSYDWYNLETDKLNQVWSINGSKYKPSFLYQVRMLKIQSKDRAHFGPAITEIKFSDTVI